MVNITLNVPKMLHERMTQHPEIKWTEVVRQSIAKFLDDLDEIDEISSEQLRKKLEIPVEEITDDDIAFAEKMVELRDSD